MSNCNAPSITIPIGGTIPRNSGQTFAWAPGATFNLQTQDLWTPLQGQRSPGGVIFLDEMALVGSLNVTNATTMAGGTDFPAAALCVLISRMQYNDPAERWNVSGPSWAAANARERGGARQVIVGTPGQIIPQGATVDVPIFLSLCPQVYIHADGQWEYDYWYSVDDASNGSWTVQWASTSSAGDPTAGQGVTVNSGSFQFLVRGIERPAKPSPNAITPLRAMRTRYRDVPLVSVTGSSQALSPNAIIRWAALYLGDDAFRQANNVLLTTVPGALYSSAVGRIQLPMQGRYLGALMQDTDQLVQSCLGDYWSLLQAPAQFQTVIDHPLSDPTDYQQGSSWDFSVQGTSYNANVSVAGSITPASQLCSWFDVAAGTPTSEGQCTNPVIVQSPISAAQIDLGDAFAEDPNFASRLAIMPSVMLGAGTTDTRAVPTNNPTLAAGSANARNSISRRQGGR